jgi:glycosyltransferase involved in cell wall biosynthesis
VTSEPRVTAVVAAYNEERFVADALESALGQDYPAGRVDVVVVDDGSTDATAAIAERYAAASGRVRVVRQPNGGNVAATNAALALAGGDVVAILDSDDVWAPGHLRHSVDVLAARPEVGLVYGDMTVIDEHGDVLQESWLEGDITPQGRCAGLQLAGNNVTGSSIVMRASVLRELGPIPAGMPWADWWFAVRFAQVSELAYVAEPRTRYRFHGSNMSLGAQGEGRLGELRKAAGFQRHLFRTLRPGDATPRELADGWAAFERNAREATALGASPFDRILDVTAADRAEAAGLAAGAQRALDAGDPAAALWPFVRAAAADPWNERARDGLGAALAAAPGGEALPGQRPLAGAAPFVVLAAAGELLAQPELLRAYAGGMRGAAGVTLAVDATAMDVAEAGSALGALAAEAGIDDAIDVLAVAGPLDERGRARLAAGVQAMLTEQSGGALARPRFGAGDIAALRRLAA